MFEQRSVTGSGQQENGLSHGLCRLLSHSLKGNAQLGQNFKTVSLSSHSSKVILKVILNSLRPQAEEIIVDEQAGFRAVRTTTEQIFNLRILCEKYVQHQQNLYYAFTDFFFLKKKKKLLIDYGM